jgi:hypothetical protein
MKNRENMPAAAQEPAAAGWDAGGITVTFAPTDRRWPPLTTTCSPACNPSATNQLSRVPVADGDRPLLGLAFLVDQPDEMTLRALLHGALRDEDGVGPLRPLQARPHVLVGTQHPVRVIDRGADQEGPGLRVVRGIGKGDLAGMREWRTVTQLDFDQQLVVGGQLEQSLPDVGTQAVDFVLRDAEIHPHRGEHRNGRQLAVLRVDIGAFGEC